MDEFSIFGRILAFRGRHFWNKNHFFSWYAKELHSLSLIELFVSLYNLQPNITWLLWGLQWNQTLINYLKKSNNHLMVAKNWKTDATKVIWFWSSHLYLAEWVRISWIFSPVDGCIWWREIQFFHKFSFKI